MISYSDPDYKYVVENSIRELEDINLAVDVMTLSTNNRFEK